MTRRASWSLHPSFLFIIVLVSLGLLLIGCGANSSTNNSAANTPSASPTPSSAQPGPGSGSGSTGGNTGGSGSSSTSISGTVVNSQTNAPVSGTVAVALEGANPSDFTIMAQTTADAEGHFHFDNVQPSPRGWGWVVAVAAKSTDGTLFAPTLLLPANSLVATSNGDTIEPGIDVGTITLMPSPAGTIHATIESQDAAGMPQDVNVSTDSLRTFTFDRHYEVPFLSAPPQFATRAGDPSCDGATASCTTFSMTLPSANVWYALYSHNGNQFKSFGHPDDYSSLLTAHSTTGATDCNPPTREGFLRFDSDPPTTTPPSPISFQNCVP